MTTARRQPSRDVNLCRLAGETLKSLALLTVALVTLFATSAAAQTVTSAEDDETAGTLRSVIDAPGTVAGSTLNFQFVEGVTPTITLDVAGLGELRVDVDDLTLDGTGAPGLEIRGANSGDHLVLDVDDMLTDDLALRFVDVGHSQGGIRLDGTLTVETNNDTTIDVSIQDVDSANQTGALIKEGDATLFLLRDNNYTGGTEIRAGTLQGTANAIAGDIQNGGTLIFAIPDFDSEGTYAGVISDLDANSAGAVEKTGANAVTLTAPQTYTGGTILRAGTFVLDSTTAGTSGSLDLASDVTIDSGALLQLDLGAGITRAHSGKWSGSGDLTLNGQDATAVLDLRGADATISGQVIVDTGRLAIQANGLLGNVSLAETRGTATLSLQGSGSVPGNIVGTGRVEVDAGVGGSVTLRGNNNYDGGTTLMSGNLIVDTQSLPGDAAVQADTQLIFNQGTSGTYDSVLSGAGGAEKRGAGTLTLSAAHTLTGDLQVTGGALALTSTASLPGSVLVERGATLSGSGTLSDAATGLTVRGTVIPDGMQVNRATFQAGARLVHTVQAGPPPTQTQLLIASGGSVTAEVGTVISVNVLSGDYSTPINFVLISGDATSQIVDGTNFTIEGAFEFLTIDRVLSANQLSVDVSSTIDQAALEAAANTPNQRAVATALADVVVDPMSSSAQAVRDALASVPTGGAAALYDAMGAESITTFTSAHLATAARFERGIHRRVRGLSWGSREAFFTAFGAVPKAPVDPPSAGPSLRLPTGILAAPPMLLEGVRPAPGLGAWTDAWGLFGSIDGDGNSNDADTHLAGASLGLDGRIDRHGLLGIAIGYTYADLDQNGVDTRSNAHGIQTALYGGWSEPRGYLSVTGRFAWARNQSDRELVVGTDRGSAEGEFDTLDYGVGAELGANLARLGLVVLQPVASFDWTRVDRDSFNESGGGALSALNLRVEDESTNSVRSGVGLRATLRYAMDDETELVPELRMRWLHEFGDDERVVRGRFRGATTGGAFQVRGVDGASDTFNAGLGWAVALGEHLRVQADYDAIVSADALAHELGLSVRIRY